jgi:ubiquinone/menaquinone biosynthesis C-methylase UbiE
VAIRQALPTRAKVEFLSQSSEDALPLGDGTIDTVVMTWMLCSIPDTSKALRQMKRVLRGSGRLVFIEHGRSPDRGTAAWQDRMTPIWKRIGGGCHLNRKIDELITAAGFQIVELKTFYQPGPRPMTYTYQGIAQPA